MVKCFHERINNSNRRASHDLEWEKHGQACLDHVGLSLNRFENIEAELNASSL